MRNININLIKLLVLAILLGFMGGFAKIWYERSHGQISTIMYILIITVVIVVLFFIVNYSTIKLRKKLQKAISDLEASHDEKQYLKDVIELQNKKKGFFDLQYDANKLIVDINVIQGQYLNGKYDKVIKAMKEIDLALIPPYAKATCYSYYILSLFKMKKYEYAVSIIGDKYDLLEKYSDKVNLGTLINLVYAYEASYHENQGRTNEYLENAKAQCKGYFESREYNRIEMLLKGQD